MLFLVLFFSCFLVANIAGSDKNRVKIKEEPGYTRPKDQGTSEKYITLSDCTTKVKEKSIVVANNGNGMSIGVGYTGRGVRLCTFSNYDLVDIYSVTEIHRGSCSTQFDCILESGKNFGVVLLKIDMTAHPKNFENQLKDNLYTTEPYRNALRTLEQTEFTLAWRWQLVAYTCSKIINITQTYDTFEHRFEECDNSITCFAKSKDNHWVKWITINTNGATSFRNEHFKWELLDKEEDEEDNNEQDDDL
jgi:hypothetical protein